MKSGVSASVDAAGGAEMVRAAAEAREASAGEQLALLDEENRELDAKLPLAPPPVPRRGAGRPPGARNKRTQQLAAYYLGRYGDPLEALLALGTGDLRHTLAELRRLSAELGIPVMTEKVGGDLVVCEPTVMGLLEFKREVLRETLPYLHAKLAPTDDKGDPVVPILALGTVAPGAQDRIAQGGAMSILDLVALTPAAPAESEPDQGLSEGGS